MCTVQDGVRRAVAPHHRLHHPGHRGSRRQHPRVRRHIQVTVDILSSQVPPSLSFSRKHQNNQLNYR